MMVNQWLRRVPPATSSPFTAQDVVDLAALAARMTMESNLTPADRTSVRHYIENLMARVLTNATDANVQNRAYEYFRMFGWSGANANHSRGIYAAVSNYVRDRVTHNPNDWQFQANALALTDLGRAPRLEAYLRFMGVPGTDQELEELVRSAVQRHGENTVRQAIANCYQWNVMTGALRGGIANPTLLSQLNMQNATAPSEAARLGGVLQQLQQAGNAQNLNLTDLMRYLAGQGNVENSTLYQSVSDAQFATRAEQVSQQFGELMRRIDSQMREMTSRMDTVMRDVQSSSHSGPGFLWWNNSGFTTSQNASFATLGCGNNQVATFSVGL
jgi:hypothetical protein